MKKVNKIKLWLTKKSAENMNGIDFLLSVFVTVISFVIPLAII